MNHASFAPPSGFGPGSQPDDGTQVDWTPMPSGMRTYDGTWIDVDDAAAVETALDLMARLADAAAATAEDGRTRRFDLADLDRDNLRLVAETLGEGEVKVLLGRDRTAAQVQESVFAGIWSGVRERPDGAERWVEVGAVPACVTAHRPDAGHTRPAPWLGVVNAPALITEIDEAVAARTPDTPPHVINLSLLPHTPEDLEFLAASLGEGPLSVLSTGYGNCRIDGTCTPYVWRVRFYNSMDVLILDTIEVTDVPEVAKAAPEDLADSAARLREVLESVS